MPRSVDASGLYWLSCCGREIRGPDTICDYHRSHMGYSERGSSGDVRSFLVFAIVNAVFWEGGGMQHVPNTNTKG